MSTTPRVMTKDEFLRWENSTLDVIQTRGIYVDLTGDVLTAILLSQIIFWHLPDRFGSTKLRVQHDGQMWLAKTHKQWSEEIRLSDWQVHRGLAELEAAGFIECSLFKFNGAPTGHVRLIWEVLLPGISAVQNPIPKNPGIKNDEKAESIPEKPRNPFPKNQGIHSRKTKESYVTEITSENTTESTWAGEPDDSLAQDVSEIPLSEEDETPEVPGSPDDSPGLVHPGRLFPGKKKTTQEAPDVWFRSAQDFYARLLAKNKIMREPNLKKWAATLKEFIDSGNVTREEFREIRLWYCDHIGEEHVPEAYSMEGFCEKFVRIKAARDRTVPQQKKSKNRLAAEEAIRRRREQADE